MIRPFAGACPVIAGGVKLLLYLPFPINDKFTNTLLWVSW